MNRRTWKHCVALVFLLQSALGGRIVAQVDTVDAHVETFASHLERVAVGQQLLSTINVVCPQITILCNPTTAQSTVILGLLANAGVAMAPGANLQTLAAGAAVNVRNLVINNGVKVIVDQLTNMVSDVTSGTLLTYVGAGLSQVNITLATQVSPLNNVRIRTLADKAKPFTDIAGSVMLGVSAFLNADGTDGGQESGIIGAVLMVLGPFLRSVLGQGSNEDDAIATVNTGLNAFRSNLEALEFYRVIWDDLKTREQLAKRYYDRAETQLPLLKTLVNRTRAEQQTASSGGNVDLTKLTLLVDSIAGAVDEYLLVANFVDAYSEELQSAYDNYSTTYPGLASQIAPALRTVKDFRNRYATHVQQRFLAHIPLFRAQLVGIRVGLERMINP